MNDIEQSDFEQSNIEQLDFEQPKPNISRFFITSDPKTRFRFLPALLVSYGTPILLALIFSLLGAATNPPLAQVYLLLLAVSFCLMGMLTRSKLMGLLNIVIAPLSFLTIHGLSLLTSGFIYNAFGVFSSLSIENTFIVLANNLNAMGQSDIALVILQNSSTINAVLIIIDLVFVILIAFFLGLALSTLSTGMKNKDGSIATMALISKPLAGIFAILLLLLLPFTYHGTANLVVGTIDMATGTTELAAIFNPQNDSNAAAASAGAMAAQVDLTALNLTDPQVQEWLRNRVNSAKEWFMKASQRFDHVQANFLLNLVLQAVVPPEIALQTGDVIKARNIPQLLDLTDIFVDVLDAFPHLVTGYADLVTGADIVQKTLNSTGFGGSVLPSSTASLSAASILQLVQYDPQFKTGLQKIQNGINEFQQAEKPIISAVDKALSLLNDVFAKNGSTQQYVNQALQELKHGLPMALNASEALIPAANGTYKALLAQKLLGLNAFQEALIWLSQASEEIDASNALLQVIDTSPLDQFNGSIIPFKDSLNFMKDLITTYSQFISVMEGSIESFLIMNATLVTLENLNYSALTPSSPEWDQLRQNITDAQQAIDKADNAYTEGATKTSEFLGKAQNNGYGIFSSNAESIFSSVNDFYSTFITNMTDYKQLVFVFGLTFNATYEFMAGQYNLKLAIQNAIDNNLNGTQFGTLTTTKHSEANFTRAKEDSYVAYNLLSSDIRAINNHTREQWKDVLYEGVNNEQNQSIHGASNAGLEFIALMNSTGSFNTTYAQIVLDYFEAIDFGSVFQQQGGSSLITKAAVSTANNNDNTLFSWTTPSSFNQKRD